MINLNISKQDLESVDALLQAVEDSLSVHLANFVPKYEEDDYQYSGEQNGFLSGLALSGTPLGARQYSVQQARTNKSKYICDTAQMTFLGNQPSIGLISESDEDLIPFKRELEKRDFMARLYDFGKDMGVYGVGYMLNFVRDGDKFPRFAVLDPKKTNVVFECGVEPRSLFGFTYDFAEDLVGKEKTSYYLVTVYTDKNVFVIRTKSFTNLNTQVVDIKQHFFGSVPITEARNNKRVIGDARPAYSLINVRNDLQTNRLQNIQDVIDYVLLIKNADVGNEEDIDKFVELLKKKIIALKGDNADARFLTNPLDQSQVQSLLESFDKDIVQITHIPDFTDKEFAQSSSNVALQTKLLGFIGLLKEKARFFVPAVKRVLLLAKEYCLKISQTQVADFDSDLLKIELKHTLPSNDQEMVSIITNLANIGLIDPRLLERLSFINNIESYLNNSSLYREEKATLDILLKSINTNSGGTNDTNIERQNATPVSQDQQDNAGNAMVGDGNKLSYEK